MYEIFFSRNTHSLIFFGGVRSNTDNTQGYDDRTDKPVKLSKNQRYRRNRAARAAAAAAAAGGSASTQPNPSVRPLPPKPSKSNQSQSSQTQQRKAIEVSRRQQKTPSAFLKLPADVLAQIVPYLDPLDVIYLARVNRTVRKVLMHKSASSMWRGCIENAGLPVCPPELTEPRYVSILHQPICSACGVREERKPDTYLFVRFCPRCCNEKLVDWRAIEPVELQSVVFASEKSCLKFEWGLKHSLKQEVEEARARLHELRSSGDQGTLQAWMQGREAEVRVRKERGDLVAKSLEIARQNKANEVKQTWRKQSELRLLALGYTQKEEDLPRHKQSRWNNFFNRTDDFTETKWERLKLRLVDFIETEAKERPERERKERRSKRDYKLRQLFQSLRRGLDTLPDDLDELSLAQQTAKMVDWLPLPGYDDALEWTVIQGLLETEASAEETETRFHEHREEIRHLVEGLVADPPRARLPVNETETDPFEEADADTSLLLRADSFFTFEDAEEICSYDILVQHIHEGAGIGSGPLKLTSYTYNAEASAVARALLSSLGHPDASGPEFNTGSSEWFRCGRCQTHRMAWHFMVKHYIDMAADWKKAQSRLPLFSELGITYNNTHDLKPGDVKPLLTQLSAQEIADVNTKYERLKKASWVEQAAEELGISLSAHDTVPTGDEASAQSGSEDEEEVEEEPEIWQQDRFACKLCEQGKLGTDMFIFLNIPGLFDHLRNAHNVLDPQRGLDLDDRDSIKNSPYFRLSGQFEGLTFGWSFSVTYD
ncbi:hypothetical protein FRC08_005063 [Ceratobasidium sp. 394]|nr:hypothetical protein FRC08_005063 [Ceratobasidium sp. 394]